MLDAHTCETRQGNEAVQTWQCCDNMVLCKAHPHPPDHGHIGPCKRHKQVGSRGCVPPSKPAPRSFFSFSTILGVCVQVQATPKEGKLSITSLQQTAAQRPQRHVLHVGQLARLSGTTSVEAHTHTHTHTHTNTETKSNEGIVYTTNLCVMCSMHVPRTLRP